MGGDASTIAQNPSDTPNSGLSSSTSANESQMSDLPSNSGNPIESDSVNKIIESQSTEILENIAKSETSDQDPTVETSTVEDQTPKVLDESKNVPENGGEGGEGEEEEEGECGFCLFMKGGGCKDNFIAWEKCIEEAEQNKEDIVDKCFEVTGSLKKCMEAHSDYYEPILRAEKAAEEVAVKELEKEKDLRDSEQNEASKNSEQYEGYKDLGQSEVSNEQDLSSKGSEQHGTSGDRKFD